LKLTKIIIGSCILVSTVFSKNDVDTRFNYFGNIAASKLSQDGYSLNNYDYDNVDENIGFSSYSKIGAQLSVLYNNYTFTAQALSRKNHDEYDTELTWFNAKYDFNNNFSLKVGRIHTSVLLNSNSIDIDYVHLWAKAPDEVYRLQGINTLDGIELTYKNYVGEYDYTVVFTPYAKSTTNLNTSEDTIEEAILDNGSFLKVSVEKDDLLLQASYAKADLNLPSEDSSLIALRDALSSYGNDVSRFSYADKKFTAWTVGLKYDSENYIINSEYARIDINSLLPDMSTYFVLLGYRYNNMTPFYIYARNNADKEHFNTSGIVGPDALKNNLDSLLYSTNTSQKTSSIGVRYDYKPGIAITAQIDRTSVLNYGKKGSLSKRGILGYDLDAENKTVYLYTLGVSFAF
jgi:hypothetical protein